MRCIKHFVAVRLLPTDKDAELQVTNKWVALRTPFDPSLNTTIYGLALYVGSSFVIPEDHAVCTRTIQCTTSINHYRYARVHLRCTQTCRTSILFFSALLFPTLSCQLAAAPETVAQARAFCMHRLTPPRSTRLHIDKLQRGEV